MVSKVFKWEKVEILGIPDSFVACDLKIGRFRRFTVLIKSCEYSRSSFNFYLDQHDLSQRSFIKDQISGE